MTRATLDRLVKVAKIREDLACRALAQAVDLELDAARTIASHEERVNRMRAVRQVEDPEDYARHAAWAMREELSRRSVEASLVTLRGVVEERRTAVQGAVLARRVAAEVSERAAAAASAAALRAEEKARDELSGRVRKALA